MDALTGFIGLGHMGGALARRLMTAGHSLIVHDRNPDACREFARAGARVAASPREIADQAPVVFLCLPSIEAEREVAGGPNGLAGGSALKVLVETSTVGPAAIRDLVALMAGRNVAVVDAPVSGGPRGAQAGTLSLMHAASKNALAQVLPQLAALAAHRFDVGTEPGLAQVCKLVNNAISAAGMVAACEAAVLGVKAGLDAGTMLAAINAARWGSCSRISPCSLTRPTRTASPASWPPPPCRPGRKRCAAAALTRTTAS
jgi:3-hydroxyisobutyrate dehydrogenase-like beta-hydroxyacid dehydrogenase